MPRSRLGYAASRSWRRGREHVLQPSKSGEAVERAEHVALEQDIVESHVDRLRLAASAEQLLRLRELRGVHVHVFPRARRATTCGAPHLNLDTEETLSPSV